MTSQLMALLDALELAGTGVAVIREKPDGLTWIRLNEPYVKLLGYTVEEAMSIPVFSVIDVEQRHQMIALSAAIRGGRQDLPPALEMTLIHKNGSKVPIAATLGRREDPEGAIVVALVQDQRSQQGPLSMLEADRVSLVGALAAGFGHEINNPLTTVLLNLRALRRQLAHDADLVRCVDDITTGAERIANNVRAFQTLATRGARRPIDLAQVVGSALRLAAPSVASVAQVIRQILPVGPVIGEESRIGQAVLAMMLFAASGFDREAEDMTNNRITVVVEERGDDAIVEVTDNGRPLADDEAKRAFDPFFRSPVRGAGVGVGLGVARSVAATFGGNVILEPRIGGGAAITMRLPMVPA